MYKIFSSAPLRLCPSAPFPFVTRAQKPLKLSQENFINLQLGSYIQDPSQCNTNMAIFRQYIVPLLVVLVFLFALVAVSARIFLPSDMAAPAPIEEVGVVIPSNAVDLLPS